MKILIACEESQAVCKAFRAKGHEAYSCDVLPCSGGHPEWHIEGDVLEVLDRDWDMMIAHPPCTFLSRAGTRWLFPKGKLNIQRYEEGKKAKRFFEVLKNSNIPLIAVENPIPHKVFDMPEPTQIIQPFEYGHPLTKRTCLWLKGLPKLEATNVVEPEYYYCKKGWRHSKLNGWSQKRKSQTFAGIAKAMAEQWGNLPIDKNVED
jgi:hypothetical protein